MTPAKIVKLVGFKNLSEVSRLSGVSMQTLDNWFKYKPEQFQLMLQGLLLERQICQMDAVVQDFNSKLKDIRTQFGSDSNA